MEIISTALVYLSGVFFALILIARKKAKRNREWVGISLEIAIFS